MGKKDKQEKQRVTCPNCKGNKGVWVADSSVRGTPPGKKRWYSCSQCGGDGWVTR